MTIAGYVDDLEVLANNLQKPNGICIDWSKHYDVLTSI